MPNSLLTQHLRSILILRDLDERSIQGISHFFETKTYVAGEFILTENDDSHHVLAMCNGMARVTYTGSQSKQILIRDILQGELFGDWAAIDNLPRSANVQALTDCCVGFISQQHFLALLNHNPQVALRQMQQLTGHLRHMNVRMSDLITLKANQRIHRVLLELANPSPDGLLLQDAPSHHEIAMRASTQREVVARELSKLQGLGLLVKQKSSYLIPNPEKLSLLGRDTEQPQ